MEKMCLCEKISFSAVLSQAEVRIKQLIFWIFNDSENKNWKGVNGNFTIGFELRIPNP
jgi:hypothetical protein